MSRDDRCLRPLVGRAKTIRICWNTRISIDDQKVAAGAGLCSRRRCGLGALDPDLLAFRLIGDQPGNFLPELLTKTNPFRRPDATTIYEISAAASDRRFLRQH